jgi:glucose/arabinose dehydrogenase
MAPPWHQWTPSIAPSGLVWVQGDRYPGWRGSLLVGALKARRLVRLVPDGDRPPREQVLLARLDRRIRDVRQAPDGWLFVLTDERDGQLLRLRPVPAPPVSLPGSGGTP